MGCVRLILWPAHCWQTALSSGAAHAAFTLQHITGWLLLLLCCLLFAGLQVAVDFVSPEGLAATLQQRDILRELELAHGRIDQVGRAILREGQHLQ